jgi:stearoyl-CoA desaturase (delta-9 desaturase)
LAWGWGLSWLDVGLAVGFYFLSGFGITAGFHRYFTHRAFKADRGLRNALAIAGSLALQGDVLTWVADHRRHHAFTDKEGDPHSPWLFGTTPAAVARGFWHSHMGWTFNRDRTNVARFAPDLLADRDISRIGRQFPLWTVASLLSPALLGGLITMTWWGALTAFFWAGLVRVAVLHHVTCSVNSICHIFGDRPWTHRDRSTNVWPLAIASMGEAVAQPAPRRTHLRPSRRRSGPDRHDRPADLGVREARWAHDVRWPTPKRLARLRASAQA